MQKLAILGKNVVNRTETILRYYIQFSVRFCAVSLTKIHVSGFKLIDLFADFRALTETSMHML